MQYSLYTDGSYNPDLNISSMGGYLMDEKNHEIFNFSEQISDSRLLKYHELCALRLGLQKAISFNIKKIICYSDDISIRNFNTLQVSSDYPADPIRRQLLLEILELKNHFELIYFKHIFRNFNKKADKLAEKNQLEYFYENITFKERYDIQSQKLLKVPNLVCADDFYSQKSTPEEMKKAVAIVHEKMQQVPVMCLLKISTLDENNGRADLYLMNTKEQELLDFRTFDIKKVNSHCLDLLETCFQKIHSFDEKKLNIGLIIESDQLALKKFEMLLRQRFIFPKTKTPLVHRFLQSCERFDKIFLTDATFLKDSHIH